MPTRFPRKTRCLANGSNGIESVLTLKTGWLSKESDGITLLFHFLYLKFLSLIFFWRLSIYHALILKPCLELQTRKSAICVSSLTSFLTVLFCCYDNLRALSSIGVTKPIRCQSLGHKQCDEKHFLRSCGWIVLFFYVRHRPLRNTNTALIFRVKIRQNLFTVDGYSFTVLLVIYYFNWMLSFYL